jgi:hypothetical protein
MGLTRAQAEACGIGHLYPTESRKGIPAIQRPAVSLADTEKVGGHAAADFPNKLEWHFWKRLWEAKEGCYYDEVLAHSFKLTAIGDCRWYEPDFVGIESHAETYDFHRITVFETKGWRREDAVLKLIATAARYPWARWVEVQQVRKRWEFRDVTAAGISREVWCPNWAK